MSSSRSECMSQCPLWFTNSVGSNTLYNCTFCIGNLSLKSIAYFFRNQPKVWGPNHKRKISPEHTQGHVWVCGYRCFAAIVPSFFLPQRSAGCVWLCLCICESRKAPKAQNRAASDIALHWACLTTNRTQMSSKDTKKLRCKPFFLQLCHTFLEGRNVEEKKAWHFYRKGTTHKIG